METLVLAFGRINFEPASCCLRARAGARASESMCGVRAQVRVCSRRASARMPGYEINGHGRHVAALAKTQGPYEWPL